jgi:dethiobiotin synthetase
VSIDLSLQPGLFVVGTDTGVGKTAVACALARIAHRSGKTFVPFKPVETGCSPDPADARALWLAADQPVPVEQVVRYTFPLPAAPSVAATAAGITVDILSIVDRAASLRSQGAGLLVEGAGGLLVPFAGTSTTVDIALCLALPLLLVGRAALGTINHCCLATNEIRRRGLALAGIILVETSPGSHDPKLDNLRQIELISGVRPLGVLPFVTDPSPDRLADALLAALGAYRVARLLGDRSAL